MILECQKNKILLIILSGRISKKASRQGNIDENFQLNICNNISQKYNITIRKSKKYNYIPTNDGSILKIKLNKKYKNSQNKLKSFDAKITGNIKGYLYAKVVYGSGGHQDNVFKETYYLCEWVVKFYNKKDIIFIILIDTDLIKKYTDLKKY